MTRYNVIESNISHSKRYGVQVIKEKTIEDISTEYSVVKYLVDTCNHMEVDFDHFEDILENYAEDYKTF